MQCNAMLCHAYPIDVRTTPDLDATSPCDGPEAALAMSQFLGIRPRQHRLDLFTRGATERLALVPWLST